MKGMERVCIGLEVFLYSFILVLFLRLIPVLWIPGYLSYFDPEMRISVIANDVQQNPLCFGCECHVGLRVWGMRNIFVLGDGRCDVLEVLR